MFFFTPPGGMGGGFGPLFALALVVVVAFGVVQLARVVLQGVAERWRARRAQRKGVHPPRTPG